MMPTHNDGARSIFEHIAELRTRLLISIGSILAGSIAANFYYKQIIALLLYPVRDHQLIFLSPLEPLFFIFKIDFLVGIILAIPVINWCFFSYVKPAFAKRTMSTIYAFYSASLLLLACGIAYAYFVTIPITLKFLFSLSVPGVQTTITAGNYLTFFLGQSVIIALVFQIPVILITGLYARFFTAKTLSSKRRYIYLIGTIAFAIITPTTDVFSLCVVLLPSVAIFEISVIVGRIMAYVQSRKAKRLALER